MENTQTPVYVELTELENLEAEAQKNPVSFEEGEEQEQDPLFPEDELLAYPEVAEELEMELDYFDAEKQEDKLWQARTGLNHSSLCGAIETIIFMSDKPVSLAKIRKLIDEDLPLRVIHESIAYLQDEYEAKHHGIRLMEVAEGFQFRTKATYSKYVQDLFNVSSLVLSPTALEVLAIIAYKQPVPKTEVDKIRGVDSSHIVRGLMDKRLVKVVGRSEEMGRPVLYGTTQEFLEVFNLSDISQLPPEHELESMVEDQKSQVADIKTLVHSGDKGQFNFDEIDELDTLAQSIKGISADTDFTESLKVEEKKRKDEKGEEVKSAFDLLEDYLDKQQVAKANEDSSGSELFTAVSNPDIVKDLNQGPFNVPEEEDEEEFQMIDLETGEPIPPEEIENVGEDVFESAETDEERKELEDALEAAFERLTGSSSETLNDDEEELKEEHDEVDRKSEDLERWADDAVDKASEFDLDLNFLKSGDTKNNQDNQGEESSPDSSDS